MPTPHRSPREEIDFLYALLHAATPCDPASLLISGTTALDQLNHLIAHTPDLSPEERVRYGAPPLRARAPGTPQAVITGKYFTVYYDISGGNAVSQQIAQDVSDTLDRVIPAFVAYFGASYNWANAGSVYFDARTFMYTDPTTKTIHLNPHIFNGSANNKRSRDSYTTHEGFHAYQFSNGWRSTITTTYGVAQVVYWVLEGTAVWAELMFGQADQKALSNPQTLLYWFDHPDQVQLCNLTSPAQGYTTLPFWMWLANSYPNSFKSFLSNAPGNASYVVDQLAALCGNEVSPGGSFEYVVTLFGAHLVNGTWNAGYGTIYDVQQPIETAISIPAFAPAATTDWTQQLTEDNSKWTNTEWPLANATIGFFLVQFRLPSSHNPSLVTSVFEMDGLSVVGQGYKSYFCVLEYPSTASIELGTSDCVFPSRRIFNDPAVGNVYLIVSSDQHPVAPYFNDTIIVSFTAYFSA